MYYHLNHPNSPVYFQGRPLFAIHRRPSNLPASRPLALPAPRVAPRPLALPAPRVAPRPLALTAPRRLALPAPPANPKFLAEGTFCSQEMLDKLSSLPPYKPDLSGYFKNQSPNSTSCSNTSPTSSSGYKSVSPDFSSPESNTVPLFTDNTPSFAVDLSEPTIFTPSPVFPTYPNVENYFENPVTSKRSYKAEKLSIEPDQTPKRPKYTSDFKLATLLEDDEDDLPAPTASAQPILDAPEPQVVVSKVSDFNLASLIPLNQDLPASEPVPSYSGESLWNAYLDQVYTIVVKNIIMSKKFSNFQYRITNKFHTYDSQQKAFAIQFLTESDLSTACTADEPMSPDALTPSQIQVLKNFEETCNQIKALNNGTQ